MPRIRQVLSLFAVLSLAACGDGGTLWGGESEAKEAERVAAETQAAQVPVQAVQSIEIGRTRDGFLITAHGTAPGLGYSLPTLRPRRGGAPAVDGYVEYDFVASEPPAGFDLPAGTTQTRQLRAYLPVSANALRGAAGIRVMALRGGAQMDFGPPPPPPG
jgi:hypothetical protein